MEACILLLSLYSGYASCESGMNDSDTPTLGRQLELQNLINQECGSCHGLHMNGGLGLPLTPDALTGKPVEALRDTILYGRQGTAMPPWKPFLTRAEAEWIVQILLEGLP